MDNNCDLSKYTDVNYDKLTSQCMECTIDILQRYCKVAEGKASDKEIASLAKTIETFLDRFIQEETLPRSRFDSIFENELEKWRNIVEDTNYIPEGKTKEQYITEKAAKTSAEKFAEEQDQMYFKPYSDTLKAMKQQCQSAKFSDNPRLENTICIERFINKTHEENFWLASACNCPSVMLTNRGALIWDKVIQNTLDHLAGKPVRWRDRWWGKGVSFTEKE